MAFHWCELKPQNTGVHMNNYESFHKKKVKILYHILNLPQFVKQKKTYIFNYLSEENKYGLILFEKSIVMTT